MCLAFVYGVFSDDIVMKFKKKIGPTIDFIKSSINAQELSKQDITLVVTFLEEFEVDVFLPVVKHTTFEKKKIELMAKGLVCGVDIVK
jgi:hypothetical protein